MKDTLTHPGPIFVLVVSAALSGAVGCDGEGAEGPARGPDRLGIGGVRRADGTAAVKTSGGTLTLDCSNSLLVSVAPKPASNKLGDFLLAPPGGCSTTNCGWMALSVTSEQGAAMDVLSAQSPIAVELPASMRSGRVTFRIELRDSDGAPVLTENDEVLAGRFEVVLQSDSECNEDGHSSD